NFGFTGKLTGDLTFDSSTLQSTFLSPLTLEQTLGGRLYSVTISSTSGGVPAPNSGTQTEIDASVQIGQAQNPPPVTEAPEPGTRLLGGMALPLFAAARAWRRRRDG